MGPISLTISVDAPRERVFDFICDLSTRLSWIDHFASDYRLERVAASGQGAAARFRVDAPAGVRYMETVIAEADRPYRVVEHGRGGRLDRMPIRIVWELEEGPTTTVTLTFWTAPATAFDRIREFGRSAVVETALEQGAAPHAGADRVGRRRRRTEVAGGDRVPA